MTFRLPNRRKRYPVMTDSAWVELGGFCTMTAMVVGVGAAVLLEGMTWAVIAAAFVGLAYVVAVSVHFNYWSKGL